MTNILAGMSPWSRLFTGTTLGLGSSGPGGERNRLRVEASPALQAGLFGHIAMISPIRPSWK